MKIYRTEKRGLASESDKHANISICRIITPDTIPDANPDISTPHITLYYNMVLLWLRSERRSSVRPHNADMKVQRAI